MDKLKIKYNYLLARIRKGELYVSTTEFLRSTPADQDRIIKFLESLNIELSKISYELENKYNYKMTKEEIEDGFKE